MADPKWEDTEPIHDEAPPKFEDTLPVDDDHLDVGPVETGALHALNPLGLGKTLMGVGEGVSETLGGIEALRRHHTDYGPNEDWKKALLDRYQKGHAEGMAAYDAAGRKNPKAALGGDVANAIGMGLLTGPLSKAQKAATAMGLAETYGLGNSDADITKPGGVSKLGRDVGVSGLTGLATSMVPGRTVLGGLAGAYLARDDVKNGDLGKAAAKTVGGAALATALPKIPGAAKRLFSNTFGVNPEAIDDYIARSEEINSSPTKSHVRDAIDTVVTTARDRIEGAKQAVRDRAMDTRQEVRDAVTRAEAALERAQAQKTMDTAAEVEAATNELQKLLVAGSKAAKETIPTAKTAAEALANGQEAPQLAGGIKRRELVRQVSKRINALSPAGPEAGPTPGGARQSAARLGDWRDWLKQLPEYVTYKEAKPIIQKIDQETQAFYGRKPGEFAPEEQVALARLRQYIDMKLKAGVPEYEKAMVPVAEDARLLSGVRQNLGDSNALVSRLRRLPQEPQGGPVGDTLDALGRRTGKNFRGSLDTTAEQSAVDAARQAAQPKAVAQAIGQSPESAALGQAVRQNQPIARVGRNSESLIDRMIRGKEVPVDPSLNDQDTVAALSKELPNLPQWLKNLKTANAFTGDRTQGSRNAVAFGSLGAAVGGVLGHPIEGGAVGAGVGKVVDKYGPRMAKGILDSAVIPAKNTAQEVIAKLSANPQMSHYAKVLSDAAAKGSDSFAARYYLMQQMYPDLRAAVSDERQDR